MTTRSSRPDALPGGTKRAILDQLLRRPLSAADLAGRLGISGAAIRQHLGTLRDAGLVDRSSAAPTTGRPNFIYRLSALGRRAYPKRYDVLAGELIEVLIEKYGRERSLDVVRIAAQRVAERERPALAAGDGAERWRRLLAWLEEVFAWEAECDPNDEPGATIVIHHCPFHDVAGRYPEICGTFFATLVATLWGERVTHRPIGDGVRCCKLEVVGGGAS